MSQSLRTRQNRAAINGLANSIVSLASDIAYLSKFDTQANEEKIQKAMDSMRLDVDCLIGIIEEQAQ